MPQLILRDRQVDLDTGEMSTGGVLRPLERALLRWLALHAEEVTSLDALHRQVWGYAPAVNSKTAYSTIYRLRGRIEADPSHPVHLLAVRGEGYQLVGARLVDPPRPKGRRTNAVPVGDAFVVGTVAVDALAAAGPGIVTLVGPGGIGKTRLVQELALARPAAGGTWIADLDGVDGAESLCERVAAALPLPTPPDADGVAAGLVALGAPTLVLDNAEDDVEAAARLARQWGQAAPEARIVVTSRCRLGVPGEVVVPVEPLPPDRALALLDARLAAQAPQVAAALLPEVARALVDAAEGLPLAIEIAAANVGLLGPDVVLAALRAAAPLKARQSGAPSRHTALDRVVADVWARLSPGHQALLAALSALDGPVGFGVIRALDDGDDVAERLADLVDAALVAVNVPEHEPPSWRVWVTVRAAVRQARPVRAEVSARLLAWLRAHDTYRVSFEALPGSLAPLLGIGASGVVLEQLARAVEDEPREQRAASWVVLVVAAAEAGAMAQVERWVARALLEDPLPTEVAELQAMRGWAAVFRDDAAAVEAAFRAAFDAALTAGKTGYAVHLRCEAAGLLAGLGRVAAAEDALAQARTLARELTGPSAISARGGIATATVVLEARTGRADRLLALGDESAAAAEQVGDWAGAVMARQHCSRALLHLGRTDLVDVSTLAALRCYAQHADKVVDDSWQLEVNVLDARASSLSSQGRYADALDLLARALVRSRTANDSYVTVLGHLAHVLAALGQREAAVARLREAVDVPVFDAIRRGNLAAYQLELTALTAGPAAALAQLERMAAEAHERPTVQVLHRLASTLRFALGDLDGAARAAEAVVGARPEGLLVRAQIALRRRDLDGVRLALELAHARPLAAVHLAAAEALAALVDALEGRDPPPPAPSPYAGHHGGGWIVLSQQWQRFVQGGEAPDPSAVSAGLLDWALAAARAEAEGAPPGWLR
ncbi:MAG: winged helix-turn-helix domain-containing protein [Myxococcota bacterium]